MEVKNGQLHGHLFADNPRHLEPYAYSLGTGRQIFGAGFGLEKSLSKLMLATRRRRLLRVWDRKGLVFQAVRWDAARMRFEQCVRFPLMKFEGRANEKSPPHLWVRGGKVIVKGRGVQKLGVINCEMEYAAIERGLAAKAVGA
jgi:hypothetical protein